MLFNWFKDSEDLTERPDANIVPDALRAIKPKFGDYCFSSEFSGALASLKTRRFIQDTGDGWQVVEIQTRPNTNIDVNNIDSVDNFLKPVVKYETIKDGICFAQAFQDLHSFEVAQKVLGSQQINQPSEQCPDAFYYKQFALREGLIFDTEHRLHPSLNGRPHLVHDDALFFETDLEDLAKHHYNPMPQEIFKAVQVDSTLEAIQKTIQMEIESKELAKIIQDIDSAVDNKKNKKYFGNEEYTIIDSMKEQAKKTDNQEKKEVLLKGAAIFKYIGQVLSCKNLYHDKKRFLDISTEWKKEKNSHFTPQVEEFCLLVLTNDVFEAEVRNILANVANAAASQIDFSAIARKEKEVTINPTPGAFILDHFTGNMAGVLTPLQQSLQEITGSAQAANYQKKRYEAAANFALYKPFYNIKPPSST
jgi:hypothetical protein